MTIPKNLIPTADMRQDSIADSMNTVPKLIAELGENEGGKVRISHDESGKSRVYFDINLGIPDISKFIAELLKGLPRITDREVVEVHYLLTTSQTSDQKEIKRRIIYRLAEIFGKYK